MGVPGFFAWILRNFKNKILLRRLSYNPKYLYIDANCLFHPECFKILEYCPTETDLNKLENKMFNRIINYLTYIEGVVGPTEMMFIAVDGTAPLAKIGQQRKRRFKSIDDTKIRNDIKLKHGKHINNTWNNTVITPGTEFMEKLHNRLHEHYTNKTAKAKANISYIYSSYHTPGEGEHKILQHIKDDTDKSDEIVIYGLDADLIFLALASRRTNIFLLREEIHFGAKSKSDGDNELTDPVKDVAQDLIFVSINETRKAYNEELWRAISNHKLVIINMSDTTDFSNDLIFICFLLGNDFLPHFPSIDIHRGGLDEIVSCYINCVAETSTLLINFDKNDKVEINNVFLLLLIQKLGLGEKKQFQYELPKHLGTISKRRCFSQDKYLRDIWILENLRNVDIYDPVGLGIGDDEDWKFRYYEHYFYSSEHQEEFIDRLCFAYIEGIAWVTQYYFNKCIDWQWQFPYDNAPFISDISTYLGKTKFDINSIKFQKKESIPMMVQLISVLPPACYNLLPKSYQFLVTNNESPIIDMFPIKVQLDMLYKDQHWQCIPKIPYLNIDRISKAVNEKKMTTSEKTRSKILDNFKFINN